jgi:hypothetical protein
LREVGRDEFNCRQAKSLIHHYLCQPSSDRYRETPQHPGMQWFPGGWPIENWPGAEFTATSSEESSRSGSSSSRWADAALLPSPSASPDQRRAWQPSSAETTESSACGGKAFSARCSRDHRGPAVSSAFRAYAILPPMIVSTDSVFGRSSFETLKRSCDSTARSACLPASSVPSRSSANTE